MKQQSLLYGAGGLVLGIFIAWAAATISVNNDYRGMMQMMGMDMSRVQDKSAGHMGMSMNGMQTQLGGKTGDDFDRTFIDMMIAHHEGAVQMAKQAKQYAKHDEIKKMADDIIAAQTKEIATMQTWRKDWGYDTSGSMPMMNH